MAGFPLSAPQARQLWAEVQDDYLPGIRNAVAAALPVAEIVEALLDVLLSALIRQAPAAWAWLHDRLQAAGEAIDGRLTWQRIRNDELRQWLEERDNPYTLLRSGVRALAEAIEADIERVKGERLLALVGGRAGRAAGFFRELASTAPAEVTLPVHRQPTAEQLAAELARRLTQAHAATTNIEPMAQVAHPRAPQSSLHSGGFADEIPAMLTREEAVLSPVGVTLNTEPVGVTLTLDVPPLPDESTSPAARARAAIKADRRRRPSASRSPKARTIGESQ